MTTATTARSTRVSPHVAAFLADRIRSTSLADVAAVAKMDRTVLARAVAGDAVLAGTELRVSALAARLGFTAEAA